MSTTKPWRTKAWKQRREEILKVRDKCEWCGLAQKECLEKHKKGLMIDHVRESLTGLSLWREVVSQLRRKYAEEQGLRVSFTTFAKSYKPEIDREFARQKEEHSFERYMELRDEDIQVLCPRCHRAKTSGYVLCPKCKKNYAWPSFGSCKECNKDKIEERRRKRETRAREKAEAFAKMQRDENRLFYGVDHPELQHLKLWNCTECGEPIDFQHFCAYQSCDVCLRRMEDWEGQNVDQNDCSA